MKIFTIGYEGNSAEEFFTPLLENKIKKVIDVRLKPFGGGFASKKNLPFLLSAIGDIEYQHIPECAPTRELFNGIKNGEIPWVDFKKGYKKLIKERNVASLFTKRSLSNTAFLCYEADPDYCHRRILAEYLKKELGIDKVEDL
jgi:uncharacterized protein (DUF488 family)